MEKTSSFATFFDGSFIFQRKTPIFTIGVLIFTGQSCRTCNLSPGPGQDFLPEHVVQVLQLLLGGLPTQRDPEGAVHHRGRQPHGLENMAAVALGAGGPGADADARVLQNVDGVLGGHPGY